MFRIEVVTYTDITSQSLQKTRRPLVDSLLSTTSNRHNLRNRVTSVDSVRDGQTTDNKFDRHGDLGTQGLSLRETRASTIGYTEDGPSNIRQLRAVYPAQLDFHNSSQTDLETLSTSRNNATGYMLEDLTNAEPQATSSQTPKYLERTKSRLTIAPVYSPDPRSHWGPSPWHALAGGDVGRPRDG